MLLLPPPKKSFYCLTYHRPRSSSRRMVDALAFHHLSPLCAPGTWPAVESDWLFFWGPWSHTALGLQSISPYREESKSLFFLKVIMRQWFKVLFSSSKVLKFITVWVFNSFLYLKSASDLHLQFKAYSILERYFCFYSEKTKIIKNCIRWQSFTYTKVHNKVYLIPFLG